MVIGFQNSEKFFIEVLKIRERKFWPFYIKLLTIVLKNEI
jgi:hypothetical protein